VGRLQLATQQQQWHVVDLTLRGIWTKPRSA
jgi:hypothetical protein